MTERYEDLVRQLNSINMELQFLEQDIADVGYATREQLKQRSELTKQSVDIAAKFPDVVGNKG